MRRWAGGKADLCAFKRVVLCELCQVFFASIHGVKKNKAVAFVYVLDVPVLEGEEVADGGHTASSGSANPITVLYPAPP